MSAQTPAKITLEEITQRKKKLLNEIQAQRAMTATTREIFSPSCTRCQQSGFAHAFVQYRHGHL